MYNTCKIPNELHVCAIEVSTANSAGVIARLLCPIQFPICDINGEVGCILYTWHEILHLGAYKPVEGASVGIDPIHRRMIRGFNMHNPCWYGNLNIQINKICETRKRRGIRNRISRKL